MITAGTNAGVVKEVGEALSNYRYKNRKHGFDVPCIGIGSWGYTASNELLADNPVCAYPNGVYEKSANSFTHSQNEMILPMSTVSRKISLLYNMTFLSVLINLGCKHAMCNSKLRR